MDRYSQELLIDQLIHNIDNIDDDLLEKLRNHLDLNLSEETKYLKFIKLYEKADNFISKLLSVQNTKNYDIWEIMWNKLFDDPGWVHQAYKLHKFDADIIDSSYEDEVRDIMWKWRESVDNVKKLIKEEYEVE